MLGLNDAAAERISARYVGEHRAQIEAVRVGTIIAHDAKAARRYFAEMKRRAVTSLDDRALESAIANVARMFPGNVERVPA